MLDAILGVPAYPTVGAAFEAVFGCTVQTALATHGYNLRDAGKGLAECPIGSVCGENCAIVLNGADAVLACYGGYSKAPESVLNASMYATLNALMVMYYG